jgi:citrate synthase
LLAVGSRFVGTTEECAVLLDDIVAASPGEKTVARKLVSEFRSTRKPIPGFGHHLHKPDDPRAVKLLQMSKDLGLAGSHVAAIELLSETIDEIFERHITINATGAIAAVLGDMNVPSKLMRGFAVLARTAGLIAHIAEEQEDPSLRFIWDLVDEKMADRPA